MEAESWAAGRELWWCCNYCCLIYRWQYMSISAAQVSHKSNPPWQTTKKSLVYLSIKSPVKIGQRERSSTGARFKLVFRVNCQLFATAQPHHHAIDLYMPVWTQIKYSTMVAEWQFYQKPGSVCFMTDELSVILPCKFCLAPRSVGWP